MDTIVWLIIFLATCGITIDCLIVLRRFESARSRRMIFAAVAVLFFIPTIFLGLKRPLNAPIIFLHLTGYLLGALIVDGILCLLARKRKQTTEEARSRRLMRIATAALFGCLIYLTLGFLCANWVRRTEYVFETEKAIENGCLRIAQISDVHLGTTNDCGDFEKLLRRVSEDNADILVITGDFVDEYTSREDMLRACKAFSTECKIDRVFFIAGNHEELEGADFTAEELFTELRANRVAVLQDEALLVADSFYVVGRKDASESRKNMTELLKDVDRSKYIVVLDHQPNDFTREAAAGADLTLTGHTHGGYLFPLRFLSSYLNVLFSEAECISGSGTKLNMNYIVSSGVGTWGCSFKTGTRSEYVIIDIKSIKGEKGDTLP